MKKALQAKARQATIVAAKWWTNAIAKNPTMDSFSNEEEDKNKSFFITNFAHMFATMEFAKTDEDQFELFCSFLIQRIENELEKTSEITLYCEYKPCDILKETADKVGIDPCFFPFFRYMNISNDSVKLKKGQDAGWIQLYLAKE